MSELRTNNIRHKDTTGNPNIQLNNDGTTVFNGNITADQINNVSYPTDGALGNRNMIINGSMVIDQRSSGSVSDTSSGDVYLTCDRWNHSYAAASKYTSQQVTASPAGFSKSLQLTSSAATTAGSTQVYLLKQIIEGNDIGYLGFGGVNAKTITLSFYVKASVTGDYPVAITNGANNRCYVTTFNVASTDWEYKTITLPGDTAGTWVTDSSAGLAVKFDLGSGTDFETSTTNAWQSGDFLTTSSSIKFIGTNAATFNITGVQLEVGTKATPFEHRPIGTELALCQRYYQKNTNSNFRIYTITPSGDNLEASFILPTEMRTAATVNLSGISFGGGLTALDVQDVTPSAFRVLSTPAAAGNDANAYFTEYTADAEL